MQKVVLAPFGSAAHLQELEYNLIYQKVKLFWVKSFVYRVLTHSFFHYLLILDQIFDLC